MYTIASLETDGKQVYLIINGTDQCVASLDNAGEVAVLKTVFTKQVDNLEKYHRDIETVQQTYEKD